jgi:IS30 family transposase
MRQKVNLRDELFLKSKSYSKDFLTSLKRSKKCLEITFYLKKEKVQVKFQKLLPELKKVCFFKLLTTTLKVFKMKHLTFEQRYVIERLLKMGESKDFITETLGAHRSTVYREIKRNSTKQGKYSAKLAHEFACDRKDRFTANRKFNENCRILVEKYLKEYWSPEQIVGYCEVNGIPIVSAERIYQHIRSNKENGGDLYKFTRHRLKHRKRPVGKHYPIANRVSIEERPKIVDDKGRFGDWEMDTIIGANQQGSILTLTERKTNFIFIKQLPNGKNAKDLANILINQLIPYKDFVHTITTDNGAEFAGHLKVTKKLKTPIYFAHPYCSWEKGAIEHANKLIRQFILKEADLTKYSQQQLTEIQHLINRRPREKLNFKSPKEIFYNFINRNYGSVAFET